MRPVNGLSVMNINTLKNQFVDFRHCKLHRDCMIAIFNVKVCNLCLILKHFFYLFFDGLHIRNIKRLFLMILVVLSVVKFLLDSWCVKILNNQWRVEYNGKVGFVYIFTFWWHFIPVVVRQLLSTDDVFLGVIIFSTVWVAIQWNVIHI